MASKREKADASRTATIRTAHEHPATVAAAVAPDNTAEIETRVESGAVLTTIERETTAGIQSTIDDYVVNLDVAHAVAESAMGFGHGATNAGQTTNTEQATDTNGYRDTETQ